MQSRMTPRHPPLEGADDQAGGRREVMRAPTAKPFRPREIWAGTIVMLVGIFVGTAAVISLSVLLGVVAGALLLIGAVLAIHGKIMRNTHGATALSREWADVKDPKASGPAGVDPRDKGRLEQS
jgi:hypothetical protein